MLVAERKRPATRAVRGASIQCEFLAPTALWVAELLQLILDQKLGALFGIGELLANAERFDPPRSHYTTSGVVP